MERELARAHAFLALEERRNAALPAQVPIANADDFNRRFSDAVTQYMAFLESHEIMTVRDYMEPALRARIGTFNPGVRASSSRKWTTATARSCGRTTITGSTWRRW